MKNKPLVLVVDDEKPMRNFVSKNLTARGFRVITAHDGVEALGIIGTHQVDLVILDIMMPHMDGLETTRIIREDSNTPIIIITALKDENSRKQAIDLKISDYITKPFGIEELLDSVKALF